MSTRFIFQRGTSLVELMVTTLFSSILALGSVEWYLAVSKSYKTQAVAVESNEVGQFVLSYLSKAISRAGAGLASSEHPIEFDGENLLIRYRASLVGIGEVKNCLANSSDDAVILDRFSIEEYSEGGSELKCSSSGRVDWLTEGVSRIQYRVAVDQGRFEGSVFISGEYDGIPDAYLSQDMFEPATMKPVALEVIVSVYRPMDGHASTVSYWTDSSSSRQVSRQFSSVFLLPNVARH
jgi:hypothetical protein